MPAEAEATPCHVAGIMLLTLNINALELLARSICVWVLPQQQREQQQQQQQLDNKQRRLFFIKPFFASDIPDSLSLRIWIVITADLFKDAAQMHLNFGCLSFETLNFIDISNYT